MLPADLWREEKGAMASYCSSQVQRSKSGDVAPSLLID